jgi:hypothetical protein
MYVSDRSCTLPITIRCAKTFNTEIANTECVRTRKYPKKNYPEERKLIQMILAIVPPYDVVRQMMGPFRGCVPPDDVSRQVQQVETRWWCWR